MSAPASVLMYDPPVVDGFVYSLSLLYLSTSYRPSALASMEILRRAKGYRCREYLVPDNLLNPIPAFGQVEQQINTIPGSYLWGLTFSAPFNLAGTGDDAVYIYYRITDACTETPLFSDYALNQMEAVQSSNANGWNRRNPAIMSTPRLIGEPGLLNVEVYNKASVAITCQLALLMAEPCVPPEAMRQLLRQEGLLSEEVMPI